MKLYEKTESNLPETSIPPVPAKFRVGDRVVLNFSANSDSFPIMESRWDSISGFNYKVNDRWWSENSLNIA